MVGDLNYVLEKFTQGHEIYESMLDDPKASANEKAYALVGMGNCLRLQSEQGAKTAMKLYQQAFEEFPRAPAASHALLSYAYLASYSGDHSLNNQAATLFRRCHKQYAGMYLRKYKNGAFSDVMKKYINQVEGNLSDEKNP